MRLFYTLGIYAYILLVKMASIFHAKAKLWVKGRKGILNRMKLAINPEDEIIWFHSASLGEFEQGRPIIEAFKQKYPQYKILLTFFSPSGYEIRKNYQGADYVFYLPADTICNAKKFVSIVKPKKVFFIKYEYWYNYLNELQKNNIEVYFVSAILRPKHYLFSFWGKWFLQHLRSVTHFFVQNDVSEKLLVEHGINRVTISGDTRFDRVFAVASNPKKFKVVEIFKEDSKILLVGSSWEQEEDIISQFTKEQHNGIKYIIAPHEVDEGHIGKILQKFSHCRTLLFSQLTEQNAKEADILIINSIGILSSLYQYADVAFIGGGFGKGLHNILEAATFGKPIIFGAPNYQKFQEALDLIQLQGAFVIYSYETFIETFLKLLSNPDVYIKASNVCQTYIEEKKGATDKIISYIDTVDA